MLAFSRLLLLAAGLCVFAQARQIALDQELKDDVTSSLSLGDAEGKQDGSSSNSSSNKNNNERSKNDKSSTAPTTLSSRLSGFRLEELSVVARTPSSVVQDWSLVCKELCGAGLGGLPCAGHCSSRVCLPTAEELANANAILNSKEHLICQDLCRLQLGEPICNCTTNDGEPATAAPIHPSEGDVICSAFCEHNNATLTGCSLCKIGLNKLARAAAAASAAAATRAAAAHTGVAVRVTDSISQTTTTTTTTTTPDWGALCVNLCKTGDGGSLCSCDLSPFF